MDRCTSKHRVGYVLRCERAHDHDGLHAAGVVGGTATWRTGYVPWRDAWRDPLVAAFLAACLVGFGFALVGWLG